MYLKAVYNNIYSKRSFGNQKVMAQVNPIKNDNFLTKIKNNLEYYALEAQNRVPENMKFSPFVATFDISPISNTNKGVFSITHDEIEPKNLRRFFVGATKNGSDYKTEIMLKKGTKQEILDYVKDDSNLSKIIKSLEDMSDSLDKQFS